MNSQVTESFLEGFARLPDEVKVNARRCDRLWLANPLHPGLHFKKVHSRDNLFSVRIGIGWRALELLEGETVTWFWIGSHAEYDKLIG